MNRKRDTRRVSKRRPYKTPHLTVHGDLRALTKNKGDSKSDGGKPNTRLNGPPG